MQVYLKLLKEVLENGLYKKDRTQVGTYSLFGKQMQFNLQEGFPLLTTKKVHFKSILYELLWFLKGSTNIELLKNNKITIWDEWANEKGELGPIYGYQWRKWPGKHQQSIDQIAEVIQNIKTQPESRRLIVNAWNVAQLKEMALPPCHVLFQFYVAKNTLSCQLYQRSADIFLGVPFNIASYALLTMMIAQVCNLKPGRFIHTLGDVHLYANHIEQAKLQLQRKPRALPKLKMNSTIKEIDSFTAKDFILVNYDPHPTIKAPIAV